MSPHPTDVHVGAMIRMRRKMLGVTQQMLADHLGVSFQQVQKYELGANRVSASMLYKIALKLDCSTTYFFAGLGEIVTEASPSRLALHGEILEAAKLLSSIPNSSVRKNVLALMRAMAQEA